QDVDAGKILGELRHIRADREVRRHGLDFDVRLAGEPLLDAGEIGGGARDEDEVAALGRQRLGGRAADAFRCAGDERGLARKLKVHGESPETPEADAPAGPDYGGGGSSLQPRSIIAWPAARADGRAA